MKIRDFILSLVSWFILLVTVSCSDELGGERAPISSESNLHVLVPTVLSSRGTRADDASGLPTYNATVDECQINDLTLYAFPTGNEGGKLLVETLPAPLATMMTKEGIATYQLNITPGKYHIYVVANMNDVLAEQTITTEDALKNMVLDYRPTSTTGMPVCTNIPMIYEPEKDASGNLAETEITAAGDKYKEIAANLKFTCVKVKLNLIFDSSNPEVTTNFGGKAFKINRISAEKLSPFTHLYWGGKFEAPTWADKNYADKDYKDGISSTSYETSDASAVYYTEWTDNRSTSATNNNDDIKGTGDAKKTPDNAAGKWLFQQTYYLPERYISSAADRSYLIINGKVGETADNKYRINLGHKKDETSTVPVFPRGTFYEITGDIKSLGNMDLNCKVSVKDWEMVPISADFNHTTLWVSKTEASVTSTTNDYINYESNATITSENIGCETKIEGKDLIIPELEILTKQIKFRINKDINYSAYSGVYTGTAKVWIKAGNITKYIDVKYDVKPYFDVTPQEITIYSGSDNILRKIDFNTNLGGLEFTDGGTTFSHSVSEAKSNISYTNGSGATITSSITANSVTGTDQGTFSIKADQGVETSIEHTIYVQPKGYTTGKYGAEYDFKKPIKITVKPAVGNYYIYFRAINDRTPYNDKDGNRVEKNYNGTLPEGGTNNWNDGWFDSEWSNNDNANNYITPQEGNHYLYAYTQIGETTGKPKDPVWKYTDSWPGDKMKADYANTGWYYMYYDINKVQKSTEFDASGDRKIKPGETLLMFNNNFNQGIGYAAHRCPHHLEPGIPLFDYEDHEGWIVFDPTTDAMWHAFDEKPEIENIKITIYTQSEIYGWFIKYGIAANGRFIMFDTEGKTYTKSTVGSWYKTVITLKAIKGEHEKSIKLYTSSDKKTDQSIILFNGRSFKNDTGYYEGGTWHQGIPDGAK